MYSNNNVSRILSCTGFMPDFCHNSGSNNCRNNSGNNRNFTNLKMSQVKVLSSRYFHKLK